MMTKDRKGGDMNKRVEITVLVELFSTFFEKISFVHSEKEMLMKNLSKFKNFLYGNQQNLEKGNEFLLTMKEQYHTYLRDNAQMQSPIATSQQQESLHINSSQSNNDQRHGAYTQHHQKFPINQQRPSNFDNIRQSIQSDARGQNIIQQGKSFKFDISKLNEHAQHFKIEEISEFSGTRTEGVNLTAAFKTSTFTRIREFVSEVNAFYRCVGFRFLEQLIRSANVQKFQEIIKSVSSRKILLEGTSSDGSNGLRGDIEEKETRENVANTFCGYLEFIVESILRREQASQKAGRLQDKHCGEDISEVLYRMVNGDRVFDTGLVSYVKESTVRYVQESDPLYITFLLQNQEVKKEADLVEHIRSEREPLEITFKIVALTLEMNLHLLTLNNDNCLFEKTIKYNSLPESPENSLDLLMVRVPYSIFYLVYPRGIESSDNTPSQAISNNFKTSETRYSSSVNSNNVHSQPNMLSRGGGAAQTRDQSMEDLKSRGLFLKKMLKMFDENTEELMSKMSSFSQGQNDDEEEEDTEMSLSTILKQQINSAKQYSLYSNNSNTNNAHVNNPAATNAYTNQSSHQRISEYSK